MKKCRHFNTEGFASRKVEAYSECWTDPAIGGNLHMTLELLSDAKGAAILTVECPILRSVAADGSQYEFPADRAADVLDMLAAAATQVKALAVTHGLIPSEVTS